MRLALAEGRLTKWRDLLDELTPRDLTILDAYSRIEPWGDRRDDLRVAVMTAFLASASSGQEIDPNLLTKYLADPLELLGEKSKAGQRIVSPELAVAMFRRQLGDTQEG